MRRVPWLAMTIVTVVVVSVGLFSMQVPLVCGPRGEARRDMAQAAVGSLAPLSQALKLYKADVGYYPGALAGLLTEPYSLRGSGRWAGPYIKSADGLIDPWGHSYRYCVPSVHYPGRFDFDLWSVGPDGVDGTEDDICGGG